MADTSDSNFPASSRRRSSFAGQTFAELFGAARPRPSVSNNSTSANTADRPTGQLPGPITSAAAQAHRRMSLSTSGLSGSPTQPSTFGPGPRRRDSISSSVDASIDESAIEEEVGPAQASQPSSPFARRVSFGARALRDVKSGSGSSGGGGGGGGGGSDKTNGDGYNWADSFRNRAERSASIASSSGASPSNASHIRAKSVATMQPPPAAELPKSNAPDHFQERILKGDFYMD